MKFSTDVIAQFHE